MKGTLTHLEAEIQAAARTREDLQHQLPERPLRNVRGVTAPRMNPNPTEGPPC